MAIGDMADSVSLEEAVQGCHLVLHFAATTNEFKPRAYFERVNIEGTRVLAEAALKDRVERFIHISTAWVYGMGSGRKALFLADLAAVEIDDLTFLLWHSINRSIAISKLFVDNEDEFA